MRAARTVDRDIGGALRLRVIALFACVLMLNAADAGTVGAVAPQLERALHISNAELGVIAGVAALAGAIATFPVGILTDRFHRVHLLAGSIVLWSAAMLASAFAPSFSVLLITRVALGAVTATGAPTVASLTGDFFPARERAKVWGMILTGELVGAGIGVVVSGDLANALSWRYGFGWLALPGLLLAAAIWKLLVEPARGGQSRLEPGARALIDAKGAERAAANGRRCPDEETHKEQELAHDVARDQGHRHHERLVLAEDPVHMPPWRAVKYILSIRTNVVIVVASSLAYLFLGGLQTFAVQLMRSRYNLGQSSASAMLLLAGIGAFVGVITAGRLADRLLRNGRLSARVTVGAVCFIAAPLLFIPAVLSPWLFVTVPLLVLAGGALAGPNSPLNAARLDIMHPRLWGRAEGVRTFLQMLALATGPLIFGFTSQLLGGHGYAGVAHSTASPNGTALAYTFAIMLIPVAIGGVGLLWARRSYPCDVATAVASIENTAEGQPVQRGRRPSRRRHPKGTGTTVTEAPVPGPAPPL
jgi:predicted MFS family arabinose efflux permease